MRGGDAEQGGRLALAAAKSTGQVQIGVLDVLAARRRRLPMVKFDNTRYVFDTVSNMSLAQIEAYKARMGWIGAVRVVARHDIRRRLHIRPAAASTPRTGSALYWRDTFARSLPIACTTIGSRTA